MFPYQPSGFQAEIFPQCVLPHLFLYISTRIPCACVLRQAAFAGEVKQEGPRLWLEPLPQLVQLTVPCQRAGTYRAQTPRSWEQSTDFWCKQGPGDSPSPIPNYSFDCRQTDMLHDVFLLRTAAEHPVQSLSIAALPRNTVFLLFSTRSADSIPPVMHIWTGICVLELRLLLLRCSLGRRGSQGTSAILQTQVRMPHQPTRHAGWCPP